MDNFQIETAQNITIKQNVAGVSDRILAFIVDSFIIGTYLFFSGFIISSANLDNSGEWVYYLLMGVPVLLYYLLWETLWNGQTPGKAVLKIRVVKLDGSRPVFSSYLLRWLLRFIDISLSSGAVAVVTILLNGKGQRLGDLAAGTTVISERNKIMPGLKPDLDFPHDYQPVYPQVRILKDKDIREVKNLFYNAKRNGDRQIIDSLAEKLSELLDIYPQHDTSAFVQQVISDYNYYTGR